MQPEPPLAPGTSAPEAGDAPAGPDASAIARFTALTRGFSGGEWRSLAAVALEQSLGESVLVKVTELDPARRDAFVTRALEGGLLVSDRAPPAIPFAGALAEERWLGVHPEYEQLALRELQRRGQLRA